MVSGKDFPLQSIKMNQTWISTSKRHEAHVDETSTWVIMKFNRVTFTATWHTESILSKGTATCWVIDIFSSPSFGQVKSIKVTKSSKIVANLQPEHQNTGLWKTQTMRLQRQAVPLAGSADFVTSWSGRTWSSWPIQWSTGDAMRWPWPEKRTARRKTRVSSCQAKVVGL